MNRIEDTLNQLKEKKEKAKAQAQTKNKAKIQEGKA